MKRILLLLVVIITLSLNSFAQVPEGFKYQAVLRDAGNLILNNQAVGIRLTIQQGSIGGLTTYSETFSTTTNAYGLVNLEIGTGISTDDFASIDWANGPYFMETAVDFMGGASYAIMGTSKLMSVPYALYAKTSGNGEGPQGPAGSNGIDGIDGLDGSTGLQGIVGATGSQGLTGVTGLTGPQGTAGSDGIDGIDGTNGTNGPMIPYEPWNQDILSTSTLNMYTTAVYCIQFRAPSTGVYTKATMLTAPIIYFSTSKIGMAIYSNLPNQGQLDGYNTHGIPNLPLTYGSSSATITANTFFTNTLSDASGNGVTLTAGNLYWFVYSVVFSFGGPAAVFAVHGDYNMDSNSNFIATSHYNTPLNNFAPITYAELGGGINGAINASAWFRLSE